MGLVYGFLGTHADAYQMMHQIDSFISEKGTVITLNNTGATAPAKVAELKEAADIDADIKKTQEQLEKSDNEIFKYIALNSKMAIPQHEYARKFNRLKDRSEKLEKRIDELKADKSQG